MNTELQTYIIIWVSVELRNFLSLRKDVFFFLAVSILLRLIISEAFSVQLFACR
jgi:hypothetical protein